MNFRKTSSGSEIEWIQFSQISNLEKTAEGGYGIIYKATWSNKPFKVNDTIAIKRFSNSQDISKYFLNEVIIIFFIM